MYASSSNARRKSKEGRRCGEENRKRRKLKPYSISLPGNITPLSEDFLRICFCYCMERKMKAQSEIVSSFKVEAVVCMFWVRDEKKLYYRNSVK